MSGYNGPPIDHSILSPDGHISKRARAAYIAKHQAEVQRWFDAKYPPPTAEESAIAERGAEIRSLERHRDTLRDMAARGMSTRKFNRAADKIEEKITALRQIKEA